MVEQDHGFIKKRVQSILGLNSLRTSSYILNSIEVMDIMEKKQEYRLFYVCGNKHTFFVL
ncbi:hypothetical protein CJ485_23250 [Priestia filamentosa]|nr:hypothetical protein CJ485_23250 [Priestia filamentosa]